MFYASHMSFLAHLFYSYNSSAHISKYFEKLQKNPGEKYNGAMKYPYKIFVLNVLKTLSIEGNYSQGGLFIKKKNHTATSL